VEAAARAGRVPILISHQPAADLQALMAALPRVQVALTNGGTPQRPEGPVGRWIVPLPASGRELRILRLRTRGATVTDLEAHTFEVSIVPDEKVAARLSKHGLPRTTGKPALTARGVALAHASVRDASRECGSCHAAQQKQWASSRHARAWHTLVERGAASAAECVPCHTTPLRVAALGSTQTGVGCSTCHGDGFQHAVEPHTGGLIQREPQAVLCAECHTPETSPHFDFARFRQLVAHEPRTGFGAIGPRGRE